MGRVLLLVLISAVPVAAQPKLAGTWQIQCEDRPAWVSFATLLDDANFEGAAACAQRTGIRWVLHLTGDLYQPIDAHAAAVKARADAAGLTPYVIGLTDHSEWYEQLLAPGEGRWIVGDLDPHTDALALVTLGHAWASQRTAALKRIWPGVPVAWVTSLVNDDPRHGPFFYRPLPAGIDVIALEGYVPSWGTWATTAGLHLAHAIRTRPEPIVLVTQGFQWGETGDWSVGPTEDQMAGTAAALAHPRVVASWVFCWDGDNWGDPMVGLKQLPAWRERYEQAIGVGQ